MYLGVHGEEGIAVYKQNELRYKKVLMILFSDWCITALSGWETLVFLGFIPTHTSLIHILSVSHKDYS